MASICVGMDSEDGAPLIRIVTPSDNLAMGLDYAFHLMMQIKMALAHSGYFNDEDEEGSPEDSDSGVRLH